MRSVRLDPELEEQVRKAAAAEGTSVSQFIREAISERTGRTQSTDTADRLADVIGVVRVGGRRARRTGAAFVEGLADRRSGS
ncbi:MAG: ribbon-helix-helix protein, CopG family [Mycobacteriales bacterium]